MRSSSLLRLRALGVLGLVGVLGPVACADTSAVTADQNFSSNQATLLDFDFDGAVVTDVSFDDKRTTTDQLLYTIGQLNHDNSVGRLDNLVLSNVKRTVGADGKVSISYHAKLPVAWGSKTNLPTAYDFVLPRETSSDAQERFTEAHRDACAEAAGHAIETGSMWYYYRPQQAGCALGDAEVVKLHATVTKATSNSTKKYPEYQKVWEDGRLEVVSIFGKFEAGGTVNDAGVNAFNQFVRSMRSELGVGGARVVTTPANVSSAPGPTVNDVTFETTLADGKTIKVTALLVDSITSVWDGFDARYESLTPTADLIAYNGHAGLGQNVRALAKKGSWKASQYQIFFMNGCDSFAYVDGSLAQTRRALNADDPSGTKYMEFITNAMPSYFASMAAASTAVVSGLLSYAQPKSYDQIFANIDRAEVVLVTGEEDNVFTPGTPIVKTK